MDERAWSGVDAFEAFVVGTVEDGSPAQCVGLLRVGGFCVGRPGAQRRRCRGGAGGEGA